MNAERPTLSLIITVFKSEGNLPPLLDALEAFAHTHAASFHLECVFVVDGSPDRSLAVLQELLPTHAAFASQTHELTRNFGAPYALRAGLTHATGDFFSSIAADLQEPLEAVRRAFDVVAGDAYDICF